MKKFCLIQYPPKDSTSKIIFSDKFRDNYRGVLMHTFSFSLFFHFFLGFYLSGSAAFLFTEFWLFFIFIFMLFQRVKIKFQGV